MELIRKSYDLETALTEQSNTHNKGVWSFVLEAFVLSLVFEKCQQSP